jgi:hypothetical protein
MVERDHVSARPVKTSYSTKVEQLGGKMANTKTTLTAEVRVPALAAIQALRQELEREIETLSSDFHAVKRTEQLLSADESVPANTSALSGNQACGTAPYGPTAPVSALPRGLRNAIGLLADCLPARFTAVDVLALLQKQDFKFMGNPAAAVRDALHTLSHGKDPTFGIAEQGKAGKLSIYERS